MQLSIVCLKYYLFDASGQGMILVLFVKYVALSQKTYQWDN